MPTLRIIQVIPKTLQRLATKGVQVRMEPVYGPEDASELEGRLAFNIIDPTQYAGAVVGAEYALDFSGPDPVIPGSMIMNVVRLEPKTVQRLAKKGVRFVWDQLPQETDTIELVGGRLSIIITRDVLSDPLAAQEGDLGQVTLTPVVLREAEEAPPPPPAEEAPELPA